MYPANDKQFEDIIVAKAEKSGAGWSILRMDGFSFFVPDTSPVEPKQGMTARFYGPGIGGFVRGLFLDGQEVFYRTEEQQKEHRENEMYGADAADWLRRWDEGRPVWSISMGGFGPGYEQAIQITATEILRHLLERGYDCAAWSDSEKLQQDRKEIDAAGSANRRIDALGLSGAQWGSALNLALQLYRRGPRAIMSDAEVRDRHIQVSRNFPSMDSQDRSLVHRSSTALSKLEGGTVDFTTEEFLSSVRETYEEMQALHKEVSGEDVSYPDFEAALAYIEKAGAPPDRLRLEKQYAEHLGEMARLCDIVACAVLGFENTDVFEQNVLTAANEIMEYIEQVRP